MEIDGGAGGGACGKGVLALQMTVTSVCLVNPGLTGGTVTGCDSAHHRWESKRGAPCQQADTLQ